MSESNPLSTVSRIVDLLEPDLRRSAWVLVGLMVIGMVLETLGVGLMIPAIALLTKSDLAASYPALGPLLNFLNNPSQQQLLVGGMSILAIAYLIKTLFLGFLIWWQMRFAYSVMVQLSQRLFSIYLRQPYSFQLQRNSAQLIGNVTNEVGVVIGNGVLPGLALLTESLIALGICALLIAVEPIGALVVLVVLSAFSVAYSRVTRERVTFWGVQRQKHDGLRIQHLQQGLGGIKEVKLLGRESEFLHQFRVHNEESARVGRMQSTLLQLPRLGLELLAGWGLAVLVIALAAQGRSPESLLTTLALFSAAAFRLMPSVNRLVSSIQSLRFSLPAIVFLEKELGLSLSEQVRQGPARPFRGNLQLKGVTFTYSGAARPALTDISLDIPRGQSVGFIGASGAGKSTLVDVILGLLSVDSGAVLMDGVDIKNDLRNWQDQIGYVPQTIYLTDDSLRRNVAFGLSDDQIDEAAVMRAIRSAQLDELVADLPEGLHTLVGERGVRLSGGQRQRIGIARALYNDPAVLVLDEATSALDAAVEREVMSAVRALRGSKTILIVAHRMSTVEGCDRLYRLDERGLKEESGSLHEPRTSTG